MRFKNEPKKDVVQEDFAVVAGVFNAYVSLFY